MLDARGASCEYEHNFVLVQLQQQLHRRTMHCEDLRARLRAAQEEVTCSSQYLLQQFFGACLGYIRAQGKAMKFQRSLELRQAALYRSKIHHLLDIVSAGTVLYLRLSQLWYKRVQRKLIQEYRAQSLLKQANEQQAMDAQAADALFKKKFREERQDYYKTNNRKVVLQDKVFRCFRPRCGGMRFLNKNLYREHMQKVF